MDLKSFLLGIAYCFLLAVGGYIVVRSWSAAYYKSYFEALDIHQSKKGDK